MIPPMLCPHTMLANAPAPTPTRIRMCDGGYWLPMSVAATASTSTPAARSQPSLYLAACARPRLAMAARRASSVTTAVSAPPMCAMLPDSTNAGASPPTSKSAAVLEQMTGQPVRRKRKRCQAATVNAMALLLPTPSRPLPCNTPRTARHRLQQWQPEAFVPAPSTEHVDGDCCTGRPPTRSSCSMRTQGAS